MGFFKKLIENVKADKDLKKKAKEVSEAAEKTVVDTAAQCGVNMEFIKKLRG